MPAGLFFSGLPQPGTVQGSRMGPSHLCPLWDPSDDKLGSGNCPLLGRQRLYPDCLPIRGLPLHKLIFLPLLFKMLTLGTCSHLFPYLNLEDPACKACKPAPSRLECRLVSGSRLV